MAYPTATLTQSNIGGFESLVTSASVSLPATTDASHTQFISVAYRQKGNTVTPASGTWTTVVNQPNASENSRLIIFARTGVFAAGSVTLNFSGASNGIAHAVAVTGTLDASSSADAGYLTNHTAPTVTAVSAESLWVQIVASSLFPRVLTVPAGVSALSNLSGHSYIVGHGVGTIQVAAGATGVSGNWTFDDPDSATDGELSNSASLVFSEPASGAVLIDGNGEPPQVQSVVVTPPTGAFAVGATDTATVTVLDQNGDGILNAALTLTLTPTGVVSATAPAVTGAAGTTTSTLTGLVGGSMQLTATVAGVTSTPVTVLITSSGGMPPILTKRRRRK
jgi:hypothetical protein